MPRGGRSRGGRYVLHIDNKAFGNFKVFLFLIKINIFSDKRKLNKSTCSVAKISFQK